VTCHSAGLGAQPSRWATISVNRLRKIWKSVPMSCDNPVARGRTWNFSHTLYTSILPEAARGLRPESTIDPFVLVKSLFEKLFKGGPQLVFYIHLRVSRVAFDLCVSCGKTGAALPDLPFAGFIQASSPVGLSNLQAWLDARWTPVGSQLHSDPRYRREFLPPEDPSFVYFLVHGKPALAVGGRPRKQPKAPAVTLAQHPFGACSVKLPCYN
jgi:hypothetical protein